MNPLQTVQISVCQPQACLCRARSHSPWQSAPSLWCCSFTGGRLRPARSVTATWPAGAWPFGRRT